MRMVLALSMVAGLAVPAAADELMGFSGVDRSYVLDQSRGSTVRRVCAPIPVVAGVADGEPGCGDPGDDVIARLSLEAPNKTAKFVATSTGRTLTVKSKAGRTLITWKSSLPIGRVPLVVYANKAGDLIAVKYRLRGQEMGYFPVIVVFDLPLRRTAR